MTKRLLTLALAAVAISSTALRANFTFTFADLDKAEETCTLTGWSGTAPANGKLTIPNHYTDYSDGRVYMVSKIADHALDNLLDVVEIVIPSNVKYIGDADYIGTGGTNNFYNCPKLVKFTVDSNNSAFASYQDCLRQRYETCLLRVPTLWSTTDGVFTLEVSVNTIAPGAFAGNTTITTIVFNPSITWPSGNPGFASMPNLSKYRQAFETLTNAMRVESNIAYSFDGKTVLSCPPAQTAKSLTLLSSVNEIAPGAFENVANLNYAGFSANNIKLGAGAFRNCKDLQQVIISGKNCTIGAACFKGCTKLSDFSWSENLNFEADSIFAGCGFTEITFPQAQLSSNITMGHAMFDGCLSLKKVDMSKLSGTDISGHVKFSSFVTSNCPNLTTFLFPQYTDFLGTVNGNPNMGFNSNIETIVLANFTLENNDVPVFEYKDKKHTPKVYYSPEVTAYNHPLKFLFGFAYPGSYDLTIYSAVYDVTFGPPFTRNHWIVPNATYYVPGGTMANYSDAISYNCKINESYSMQNYNVEDKLVVVFGTFLSPRTEFKEVYINDLPVGTPNSAGRLDTNVAVADAKTARVNYTLDTYPMTTAYSAIKDVHAGVEDVAVDSRFSILFNNGQARFSGVAAYSVCDLTGKQLLAGVASTTDLSLLPSGIYILKATDAAGHTAIRKISLNK